MVVAFDLWLIFCCGMCGFDCRGGGDGFAVVEVSMVFGRIWGPSVGFGWFGLDSHSVFQKGFFLSG